MPEINSKTKKFLDKLAKWVGKVEKRLAEEKIHYRNVSWKDSSINPTYKKLTKHLFETQWAIIAQRNYRKKHNKTYTGSYKFNFNKNEKGFPVTFLKEPIDLDYIDIAKKINSGKWLQLQFQNKDFIRNLFKALRTGLINEDRFATTKCLVDVTNAFEGSTIKVVPCEHNGDCGNTWSISNISYSSKKIVDDFAARQQQLSAVDRNYFLINLSEKYEFVYLFMGIRMKNLKEKYVNYLKILHEYLLQRIDWFDGDFTSSFRAMLRKNGFDAPDTILGLQEMTLEKAKELGQNNTYPRAKTFIQILFCCKNYSLFQWLNHDFKYSEVIKLKDTQRDIDEESAFFANALMEVFFEEGPTFEISPDFDGTSTSPFVSLILPSVTLFKTMLISLYGESNVTYPRFVLGPVTPRIIRECEDQDQTRAAQFNHPDLDFVSNADGLHVTDFLLFWHDLIFHCMRNSRNENKSMFRYIRKLLTDVTGFDMSKTIWNITDLDGNTLGMPSFIQSFIASNDLDTLEKNRRHMILTQLNSTGKIWSNVLGVHSLLFAFDMLKHPETWRPFLMGETLMEFSKKSLALNGLDESSINTFNDYFQTMSDLLGSIASSKTYQNGSATNFIILCKLVTDEQHREAVVTLWSFLEVNNLLKELFIWTRNDGLHLKKDIIKLDETNLDKLTGEQLHSNLNKMLLTLCPSHTIIRQLCAHLKLTPTTSVSEVGLFKNSVASKNTIEVQDSLTPTFS